MSNDLSGAADELARWAENLERKAQQYQDLQGRMAAVSVTETSADKRVSVTVDANGVTTGIYLAPSSRGMDPAVLSAELMACTRRAQAKLRTQVTDLVHNAVGEDGPGQAIISQYAEKFPDPDPTDAPPSYTPPPVPPVPPAPSPTFAAAPPSAPGSVPGRPPAGTRKPNRDDIVVPDEPSEEDLYYQRKSWLE
ncbi:YbaB/EbfC family nucleoid-associated protein [Nocardia sp. NPDC057440]|uniref:YbaB/EbfC family nucleoid-associated protein n=1 Tax=Nocardia sp. NPDC057440 TaxID=3346134 RepID=UPI00366BF5D0